MLVSLSPASILVSVPAFHLPLPITQSMTRRRFNSLPISQLFAVVSLSFLETGRPTRPLVRDTCNSRVAFGIETTGLRTNACGETVLQYIGSSCAIHMLVKFLPCCSQDFATQSGASR